VRDLSAAYDGLRCADPAEPDYREGMDAIFHWRRGDWIINSFAHGLLRTYRQVPQPPPATDPADPEVTAGALAHRLPDSLRDHPDPRVRTRWTRVYRRANLLKQRYSRAGVLPCKNP
jgi:hypothetical protein